jgi:hypothetical protein
MDRAKCTPITTLAETNSRNHRRRFGIKRADRMAS